VTEDLVAAEGKPVSLTEIKNPEDVDNRLELYLYFSARNIMGLPGYLALRLGVAGPEAQVPGTLRIEESALVADGKGVSFILKAKTNGQLKPELLYAGDTSLSSGLFNCPAAGLFEPHPVKFLGVYPIRTELHFTTSKIDLQWDKIIIRADEFQIRETQSVAACYGLLAGLEKEFSASKEYLFLWDQSQLTPDRVGQVASYFERSQNYKFNVSIELRSPKGKTQIQPDSTPFLPQLRQTIAVRNAQAKITGGIIMLAVEKEVSN
jgi:hypothetical protein